MIKIGSARIDENGNIANGKAGDQTGKEVAQQPFYVSPKGWNILRAKSPLVAIGLSKAMITACVNDNVGYDQNERLGVVKHGTDSKVKTEADCSSLVRVCVREATGIDVGNFNTANEVQKLMSSGLFDNIGKYNDKTKLQLGDILITCTKGHTAIVTEVDKKPLEQIAQEVMDGKWGNGIDRMNRLHAAGYDYAEVQKIVNHIIKNKAGIK